MNKSKALSSLNCLILFFIVTLLLTNQSDLHAQNIRAGIMAGFNATQIDGDDLAGFHKFGANVGAMALVPLAKRFSASLEINYSQKGSKSLTDKYNPDESLLIRTDYADVPILFNFHDTKLIFSAGVGIATLVKYHEELNGVEQVYDKIPAKKQDFGLILNGTYFMGENFGVNVRWSYSIVPFAFSDISNSNNKGQYHNTATFRLIYVFGKLGYPWEEF